MDYYCSMFQTSVGFISHITLCVYRAFSPSLVSSSSHATHPENNNIFYRSEKQKITDSLSAQFNRPADDLLLMISTQIRTEPRVQKSINGSDILVLMGCWKLPRLIISFLLKHQNNYFTHNSQSFLVVVIFVSEAVRKEHFLRTGWNPFLSHSCDAERSPISGLWTFLFFIA